MSFPNLAFYGQRHGNCLKNSKLEVMSVRSIYTRQLGTAVAKNAKSKGLIKYHIIPSSPSKWSVVPEGSVRAVRTFNSKDQAISFTKKLAALKHAKEIIVHGADGGILSEFQVS
jgi:hypothetical protein